MSIPCMVTQVRATARATGGFDVKIPIVETHVRSLNLAVAAGIGLYEAIRQLDLGSTNIPKNG